MKLPTDCELRTLDAAAPALSAGERERARATLERIVTTDPTDPANPANPANPAARPPARRSRRRLVLVPAAALALAAGLVVVQGSGSDDAAYASWSATPTTVTAADVDVVAVACRKRLRRWAGDRYAIDPDRARVALAERRGDYVALLYRTEDPDMSTSCLVRNPPGSDEVKILDLGSGGSDGPALKAPPRGYTQGAISSSDRSSITEGAAGAEVRAVTIHAGAFTVSATVQNGRYAAWWPGSAVETGAPNANGKAGRQPILTYDLTLTDGTVIHNVQPTLPS